MITYDDKKIDATMIITLKKEAIKGDVDDLVDYSLRVVIDTEGSRYDIGVDLDDGFPQGGEDIQNIILGRVARHNWEGELKRLYQD